MSADGLIGVVALFAIAGVFLKAIGVQPDAPLTQQDGSGPSSGLVVVAALLALGVAGASAAAGWDVEMLAVAGVYLMIRRLARARPDQ